MALTEKQRLYQQEFRRKNPRTSQPCYAKELATNAAWRDKNRRRFYQMIRAWKRDNAALIAAYTRNRQAAAMQRTPPWFDVDEAKAVYTEAARLTALTGQLYTVDHVIPLRGKTVSGLHVAANMQVLSAEVNYAKGNKYVQH